MKAAEQMPDKPIETVVLHVGRHKTGTSSIQATLAAHQEILQKQGVLYPRSIGVNHSGFFLNAFHPNPKVHPNNTRFNRTSDQIKGMVSHQKSKLQTEIEGAQVRKIIFSAEDAGPLPLSGVREIKTYFDDLISPQRYKVVLYTRSPISWALSGIQQNVKGNGVTLEDAIARHLRGSEVSYSQIINNYAAVFGEENLAIRSFEIATMPGSSIFSNFCDAAGIVGSEIEPIWKNESISAEIILFLSWLYKGPRISEAGKILVNRETRVPISESDRTILFSIKGEKLSCLNPSEMDIIWDNSKSDMDLLSSRFSVTYQKPEASLPSNQNIFTREFIGKVKDVLPLISPPLRKELCVFFQTEES